MGSFGSLWGSLPGQYAGNGGGSPGGQVAGAGAATAYNPATGRVEKVTKWNGGTPSFGPAASSTNPSDVINNIINNGTAAVPDSLKALGSFSTNTLTNTSAVGAPIQGASDVTADYIKNFIGQGTGTGGDQAQDFIKQMLSGQGAGAAGTAAMTGAIDQKTAPITASQVGDVDMSKYMNPAFQAEESAILHGGDVQNNAIRARQAKAGAFGANSDVAQTQQNELTQRQLGLASSDAYKTALGAAQGDVGAQNVAKASNQGASLTDAQRALTGGATLNAGALATGNEAWQQYLQKVGLGGQIGSAAAGALGALPGAKTATTESLGPSAAGTEIGALIGLTGLKNQFAKPQGGSVSGGNISLNNGTNTSLN